jgi:Tol biopolymer transport system component
LALVPGSRLGPYEILAAIGAGGMGEVYRARDTNLGREVAIKVLPEAFAADAERVARFDREARVLASLNHPNIAAIYGLERTPAATCLVMELAFGETLAARIGGAHRAIALDEALPVAVQIASALEAAHEKGIIHRDLKPANIVLTRDGQVKVLDFGLAKAIDANGASLDVMNSPTITSPASLSSVGVILGTAAYMSPEQAKGRPADKRSDVWAFGCVLFEMLAGERAFAGETASDILAKVLEREPDWHALPGATPDSVRRLVRRCLQKDPANRLHDIADARIEIADAQSTPTHAGVAAVPSRSRFGATAMLLAAAALALALAAVVIWGRSGAQQNRSPGHAMEFGLTFPNNYIPADGVAISPDGRRIAANVWSNSGSIWVGSLDVDGAQARPLPGAELASHPFWSPDNTALAFFQGGQIVAMNAGGGARRVVTKVTEAPVAGAVVGGSWSREDVILFSFGGKLFRVSASGGAQPVEVAIGGTGGPLGGPAFLPDGRHFVFCADNPSGGSMYLASLDDGHATLLGGSVCPGGFAPPDHVLFLRGGSIVAQRLNTRRLALEGDTDVVASNVVRGSLGPWPRLTISASDTGTLAFPAVRGGGSLGRLTWFDQDGKVVGAIEPAPGGVEYLNPEICPTNDSLVAAHRFDRETGAWHIWLIDGKRGNAASRLTGDAASDVDPAWSPDGREIVYASDRDGRRKLYRQSIAGGPPVEVLDAEQFAEPIPSDVARDGRILFSDLQRSIWQLAPGTSTALRLRPSSYGAHVSPDGKWLAYAVTQGGPFEVYVERFPGGTPRKKISADAGTHPRWINGGKEIAYWIPPGGIVATDLVLTDQEIRIGRTRTLVDEPVLALIDARTGYDISRDGRRILVRQPAGPPNPGIRVIVNWSANFRHPAGE